MRKNKKLVMGLSFCLGALMLVTTAFADIVSKSGYDMLKDAAKSTAKAFSEELDSFTLEGTITVKDNDKQVVLNNYVQKVDNKRGAVLDTSSSEYASGYKNSSYSFRDNKTIIYYDENNDTYYVTEFAGTNESRTGKIFDNPFEDENWSDIEKIIDALVGSLREYVIVDEKADGSRELLGSLNEGQIPPLVNAVSSFWFKSMFSERNVSSERLSIPGKTKDVFVKSMSGKASVKDVFVKSMSGKVSVNSDGIIESVLAAGVISGKDKAGNTHDLTMEMLIRVKDVNSTLVTEPDLTGKNVEKHVEKRFNEDGITRKYVGKYKNDIIIEENENFIKIGERIIEITDIDEKYVSGRYYETYKDGYEDYSGNDSEMSFKAEIKNINDAEFEYSDSSGRTQYGYINFDPMTGRVYFNAYSVMQGRATMYDGSFSRVFEE
jgi:hypothetical protein